MKKSYIKLMWRGLRSSATRFFSILAIVALGVGFLGGLLATTPDMQLTMDQSYDSHNIYDIDIKGTLGLTEEDAWAVKELDYIEQVQPAKVMDVILQGEDGNFVTRIYGLGSLGDDSSMNGVQLEEGRLPKNSSECLVASPNGYRNHLTLGETYSLSSENKDFEDIGDTFAQTEFTVVGIVSTPLYISVENEPTTVGDGSVDLILFVDENAYSLDSYTDLFLTVKGAKELGSFSDDYTALIEDTEKKLEQVSADRSSVRHSEVIGDAQAELDDAKKEYDEKKLEAEEKLEDAWQEILDGRQELEDGKKELQEKKEELADGKKQLEDAQKQLDSSIAEQKEQIKDRLDTLTQSQMDSLSAQIDQAEQEGQAKLEENREQLEQLRLGIEEAEPKIAQQEEQLQENWAALEAGKEDLAAQRAEYESKLEEFQQGKEQFAAYIAAKRAELEENRPSMSEEEYLAAKAAIDEEEAQQNQKFEETEQQLNQAGDQLSQAEQELAEQEEMLNQGQSALEEAKASLSQWKTQYTEGTAQLAAGETQLKETIAQKRTELENSRGEIRAQIYSAAMAQIEAARSDAQAQIDANRTEIEDGEKQIAEAEAELAEAEQTLADGEKEYEEQKQEAEEKLADGEQEIEDAQAQIDELGEPEWILMDRRDNVSYSSYQSNSEKIAAIAQVFPVFFFLVAALVALTTMTRMVEEERVQIGTLKALGYKDGTILSYYVGYSVVASLFGGVGGILLGFYTLPLIIANAYTMMYTLPPTVMVFYPGYAATIIPLAVGCTTAATLFACVGQLREKPSSLMLLRAPKAGKRILLERIGFFWKKLSFTHKVTARNIFRYKKRFYMTVFGIAGCCALLVTGFGIRDSIGDIASKQFGEIYQYNLLISMKDPGAEATDPEISAVLEDSDTVESFSRVHTESGEVGDMELSIYAPEDNEEFLRQMNLRDRKSGEKLEFGQDSVVLTEKLCEQLSLKVGDTFVLENSDGEEGEFTLTGIAENYVSAYAFMSAETYEKAFGKAPEYKTLLVTTVSGDPEFRGEVSERLLKSEEVSYVSFVDDIQTTFDNMLKNIDYIVIVLIVSAGGLAVIVLYNLTNINICERKRELATLKVLGFHGKELAAYIYRETFILCLIGIVVGLFLGVALHGFVIHTAEVDDIMFGRQIAPLSFVLAAAITLLFTGLVDLIMLKKLRSIDMVESMKANE